jgi:uncharacterized protein YidB (DUF937 family)
MGLLDVLNGMQNGPRGSQKPSAGSSDSGGMSPITMAVLGLLAYKAWQKFNSQPKTSPTAPTRNANPGGGLSDLVRDAPGGKPTGWPQNTGASGNLGSILAGGLGGLLGGGAAGSILSGGLGDLLKQFQQSGQEDVAKSWVGTGANKTITPNEMAQALGPEQIRDLMAQSGLSRDELLAGLSEYLPDVVNEMTPNGRLPTDQELERSFR